MSAEETEASSSKKSTTSTGKCALCLCKNSSHRLEDQIWYHGLLPRNEIAELLQKDGQFLARASAKPKGISMVISVKHSGRLQHFQVGRDQDGWRMEGDSFPTVEELVHHYIHNKMPLTAGSGAIVTTPVKRCQWLLDCRDITEEAKLGAGQFGEVCSGTLRDPDTGETRPVAIKKCTNAGPMSADERSAFLHEAKLMLSYKHENVVRIYGVAADKPPIRIVMEFCPNGALNTYLNKHQGKLSNQQKIKMCVDAARGMEYLATRPLPCVHRDVAARNCLLGQKLEVKISDFGMSREGSYQLISRAGKQIPVRWTAPEALEQGHFTTQSDAYSFGILMWEIFADGKTPWGHVANNKMVYKMVRQGQTNPEPPGCPKQLFAIMVECWSLQVNLRPTFTAIRRRLEAYAQENNSETYSNK